MLHRVHDHISNCYKQAAEARRRSIETADPERRSELCFIEQSWMRLAQSYELSNRLEQFLLERSRHTMPRHDWQRVAVAPFDRDLELAVIGAKGIHPIAFPCRRILTGWIDCESRERLDVQPTHWREWVRAS